MHNIQDRLVAVQNRITQACQTIGRSADEVCLLAVSKTQPASAVRQAHNAGQQHFGENYLQEALEKQADLSDLTLVWHFIGPIQSNKTRPIAEHFDWVHSVDRYKIAQRLNDQRGTGKPLNICLQVNIDNEDTKSGVLPRELLALATACSELPNLRLRGLMAIPKPCTDMDEARAAFKRVATLLQALKTQLPLQPLDTLSMGMSGDLEAAIYEGATLVRIGTDIFGARQAPAHSATTGDTQ